jgi:hypothetical protein
VYTSSLENEMNKRWKMSFLIKEEKEKRKKIEEGRNKKLENVCVDL